MKLAIMQPYFFPYIGQFQLMKSVDRWIIADDFQFIDKGWINRNRILHPDVNKEWIYVSIPLSHRGQFDRINNISVDGTRDWKSTILGRLSHYKHKAPYYHRTILLVKACLACDECNLSSFVTNSLRLTASELGIGVKMDVQSKMVFKFGHINHPGEWALRISEALGATEYINPSGGCAIFREEEFSSHGIRLRFLRPRLTPYDQRLDGFVSRLSIIDIMMWNSDREISRMLTHDFDIMSYAELNNEERREATDLVPDLGRTNGQRTTTTVHNPALRGGATVRPAPAPPPNTSTPAASTVRVSPKGPSAGP